MMSNELSNEPLEIGLKALNPFQKDVLEECLLKKNGGLSLNMGCGKSLTSIVLALSLKQNNNNPAPILVIASKSLIPSWSFEIKKFFNESLKYEVLFDVKDDWFIYPETSLILTTPETAAKMYKKHNIEEKFTEEVLKDQNKGHKIGNVCIGYKKFDEPFLKDISENGSALVYKINWSCLIIDECQQFTNVKTVRCRSLAAICASYRWVLSGCLIDEPTPERILGYHLLINHKTFPRTLPLTKIHINPKKGTFKGLKLTMVHRQSTINQGIFNEVSNEISKEDNEVSNEVSKEDNEISNEISNEDNEISNELTKSLIVNKSIVEHDLTREESFIYDTLINILIKLVQLKILQKQNEDSLEKKTTEGNILALIGYLRQCVICPYKLVQDIQNKGSESDIYTMFQQAIKDEPVIKRWIDNEDNIKSSRITNVLKTIKKHPQEKFVIFSCYRIYLEILGQYITNREIFTIHPTMTPDERGQAVENFSKSDNGIMLLTYEIGSCGLNLQFANNVILVDYWWSAGKSKQAIARVLRNGQLAKEVSIYFFTSNTGIENIMFEKHTDKLQVLSELMDGTAISKVKKAPLNKILKLLISSNENIEIIKKVY